MKAIITDSIKNVNSIIRRRNYSGENIFGWEAVTALGTAWQIVMNEKSKGGLADIRLINNNTAASIVLELMFNDKSALSFVPEDSICLATAGEILNNMNLLRCNDYDKTILESEERPSLLAGFIAKYENRLQDDGLYDEPMVLSEAEKILKSEGAASPYKEIQTCYFTKPSELEKRFVDALGGNTAFEIPNTSDKVLYKFVKAYGIVNEADYVAREIVEKNLPLGEVEILCDTGIYMPYIQETFSKRKIKYAFSTGVSASGFNTIQLFKALIDWYKSGCRYKELFNVVHNPLYIIHVNEKEEKASYPFLKGISYGIGWGKDRYLNVEQNDYDIKSGKPESESCRAFREEELKKLGELALGLEKASDAVIAYDLLNDYVHNHVKKRNQEKMYLSNSLQLLRKNIAAVNIKFSDIEGILEYIKNELNGLSYTQSEVGDAVSINSISKPIILERKYTFVIGLSSREYNISSSESPVLNDELRKKLFGNPPRGNVKLAANAVEDSEQIIRGTLDSSPKDSIVTLISSSADVMRDGSDVSTSSLFKKLLEEKGKDIIEDSRYYHITTESVELPREKAWTNYDVTWNPAESPVRLSFSKSALDEFLDCPLKYHYHKDLHIDQEDYTDYNPDKWLDAKTIGTLIHKILELYCNSILKYNESVEETFDEKSTEFVNAVDLAVKEIEGSTAAPNPEIKTVEIEKCRNIASNYLRYLHKELHDTGWVVFSCEEDMDPETNKQIFNCGGIDFEVSFTGVIDRIDRKKRSDGSYIYRIVDYKTGKYKTPSQMKSETKQHLIYASYIRNKYSGEVDSFDYLYIGQLVENKDWISGIECDELTGEVISSNVLKKCDFSEKGLIQEVTINHNYLAKKSSDCTHCRYKDICLFKMSEQQ